AARAADGAGIFPVPHAQNPYFTGRAEALDDLRRAFAAEPSCHVQALFGLGGVGKTQVAVEYAYRHRADYEAGVWARAAAPARPAAESARLAVELALIAQPSGDAAADAGRALRELRGPRRRLLVLDNAPDEASVQDWLPVGGGCHALITSRYSTWSATVHGVGVDVLERGPAIDLLLRGGGLADAAGQAEAAARVAEELGFLPLALEQAAALVRRLGTDFTDYLRLYAEARRELLAQGTPGGTRYAEPVAASWRTTVGRLGPLARAALRLVAFLAPAPVPVGLLEGALDLLREGTGGDAPDGGRLGLRLALGELTDYSMVRLARQQLSVHRLTQAVQADEL